MYHSKESTKMIVPFSTVLAANDVIRYGKVGIEQDQKTSDQRRGTLKEMYNYISIYGEGMRREKKVLKVYLNN